MRDLLRKIRGIQISLKTIFIIEAIFFLGFILFYEIHSMKNIQAQNDRNGRFFASYLWSYDKPNALNHANIVMKANDYRSMKVRDKGQTFILATDKQGSGFFMTALEKIWFVRPQTITSNILHDKVIIGRLETVALNTNFFIYTYLLVLLALLAYIAKYHMAIVSNRLSLQAKNDEINDIMSNVHQGIFTINKEAKLNPEYSTETGRIFESESLGGVSFELLFEESMRPRIKKYIEQLLNNPFMDPIMFRNLNPLKDYKFPKASGGFRILNFNFIQIIEGNPQKNQPKNILKVMVVVEDKTNEFELNEKIEDTRRKQESKIATLYQILNLDKKVFTAFVDESQESILAIKENFKDLNPESTEPDELKELLNVSFREAHTLKGQAGSLNLDVIESISHELEDVLDDLREHPENLSTEILKQLNEAIDKLNEELTDGNKMFFKILDVQSAFSGEHGPDQMAEFLSRMEKLVRKESRELGKYISFNCENNLAQELGPKMLTKVRNAVIHILRNSIDHGIEEQSVREKTGKTAQGRISLRLEQEGDSVVITCEDDGRGLNSEKIKKKALEKNIISNEEASAMTEKDSFKLIFQSGLSTASEVSELSGRGVGMDIVYHSIQNIGGTIDIESQLHQKTKFKIILPTNLEESLGQGLDLEASVEK